MPTDSGTIATGRSGSWDLRTVRIVRLALTTSVVVCLALKWYSLESG